MSAVVASAAHWRGCPLQAVLLDLDGTLADSAGDVALALNRTLGEHRLGEVSLEQVRQMIGGGAQVLIERALHHLGRDADPALRSTLTATFLRHYDQRVRQGAAHSRVFPGVPQGLAALRAMGLRLAVVTNKQQAIAAQLLQQLELDAAIDCVVGRDSCEKGKPHPQPLLMACRLLGVPVQQALMVGDSANDVAAARAAGMGVVCVPYGYTEGHDPAQLGCDAYVQSLDELPQLLRGHPQALENLAVPLVP